MSSKRNIILSTALDLFSRDGYHAVGVDRIRDTAGVSKMTLYKYFPTKEDLIDKVLQQRNEWIITQLNTCVESESNWREQLRAVFAWHGQWFAQSTFHGCLFIKAVEEFPDQAVIRMTARRHKEMLRVLLANLLDKGMIADSETLSWQLLLILEGMIVTANLSGANDTAEKGWQLVEKLLDLR